MKKLFCRWPFLSLALIASASFAYADVDHTFEFVDAQGNIVADGSVINRTEVEDYGLGGLMIGSGLYVKNVSDEHYGCGMTLTIKEMSKGTFQHCFPGSCVVYDNSKVGVPQKREAVDFDPAVDAQSLQSEWLPESGSYGTCVVNYQLLAYESEYVNKYGGFWQATSQLVGNGPSVTVNFIYADPAGINVNVAEQNLNSVNYYDLSGRKVSKPVGGVYVKKMVYADGTVKSSKVTVK